MDWQLTKFKVVIDHINSVLFQTPWLKSPEEDIESQNIGKNSFITIFVQWKSLTLGQPP